MYRLLLIATTLVCCSSARPVPDALPIVRVDLVEGSRVVGELTTASLKARTQYGGLDIPLSSVTRFSRLDDGRVKFLFANGDELTAKPLFDELQCRTIFGDVALNLNHVKQLHVKSQVLQNLPASEHVQVYLGFDTADGSRVTNLAGDAMHAKNLNGKWLRKGVNGGAMLFDGSARLEIPHDPKLNSKTITFAAWVYPTEESRNYEMIMAKTNASSWHGGYGVCRMSGDRDHVRFFINGYTTLFKSRPLPIRKWTHLACVAHGEGIQFYLNGEEVPALGKATAKRETPANLLAARIQHTNMPLTLGGDPSHYGWKGVMDEFVLYDRALSKKQVQQLFHMFTPPETMDITIQGSSKSRHGGAYDGEMPAEKDRSDEAMEGTGEQ